MKRLSALSDYTELGAGFKIAMRDLEIRGAGNLLGADSSARAPILEGVFGKPVVLADGRTVTADESYVRESILTPSAKVVQGYQPIMPTFKDQVSEEEIVQLIRYIKELKPAGASAAAAAAGGKP